MLRLVYKHFIPKHVLKACKLPLKVPLATVTALVAVGVCSIPMNCRAMSTDNQKTKDKTEDTKTKDKMGNKFHRDSKPITRNDVAKKDNNMKVSEEKKKEKPTKVDAVQSWPQYAEEIRTKYAKHIIPTEEEVDELINMKISLWRGDITKLEIDAIVNAANSSLLGGGGVDGAIHRAAGRKLLEECCKLDGCRTGEAKITGGYKLPVKHVIHTVGPIGVDEKKLSSCYRNCLNIAKEHNIRTIAFPCISTGIYGYDIEKATPVVMKTIRDWLKQDNNMGTIDKIVFCVFLIKDVEIYESNLQIYFPVWPSKPGKGNAGQTEKKKSKLSETTKSTPEQTESNSRHENSTKSDNGGKGETEAKETEQKALKRNNSKENDPNGDTCKEKQAELQETVSQDENNVNVKNGKVHTDDLSPVAKKKAPNPETEKKGSETNSKM